MPFFKPAGYAGIAVETTRGTPVAPASATWIPTEAPDWTPNVTWLKDESLRGSAVDIYSQQAGVQSDKIGMKGMVYLDTFPNFLRAILGSADTVTTAPANTTLAAAASVGVASVSLTASVAAGSSISIALATGGAVGVVTGTPSGSGPYITPISPSLSGAALNGASVIGLSKHTLSLLNSASVGSQPPSYTIEQFTAGEAGFTLERQFFGSMLDELSMSFAVDAAMGYTASWLAQGNGTATATAPSFGSEFFIPAWSCAVQLANVATATVLSADLDLKRGTEAIHTLGSKFPYRVWDGPLAVSGKVSFIMETGDATIVNGTTRVPQALDFLFTEPATGHTVDMHMTQVQLENPKIDWGKNYAVVNADLIAEGNSSDAVGGGFAQIKAVVSNGQSATY